MRWALTYFFLFILLFELSHPSTNFVRTHSSAESNGMSLLLDLESPELPLLKVDDERASATRSANADGGGVHDSETAYRIVIELEDRHPRSRPRSMRLVTLARPFRLYQPPKSARV